MPAKRPLRVAMIGHGFMGAAHSQGWRVAPRFFDLDLEPEMAVVVGRNAESAAAAAERWGWQESSDDWRAVIAHPDIDLIDIVTPGDSHAEIAIAALEAGKHVLCEKPLANTAAEAEAMVAAAEKAARAGAFAMVGFTYRRVPAVAFAKQLIADGKVGEIRQVRAVYLQDWLVDAEAPLTWRLQKDLAGSGALGDIGAHIIDMTQFVTGLDIEAVSGIMQTIVTERPKPVRGAVSSDTVSGEKGSVTVDDVALFTGRFAGGVLGSFEATRFGAGRRNALRFEISGSLGAISFDLESMNELLFYDATAPAEMQGFTRIIVTDPGHPYTGSWWPAGHLLGYEHGFSNQVKDLLESLSSGTQPTPSFADGLQVQRVLDAVEKSSDNGSVWTATGQ